MQNFVYVWFDFLERVSIIFNIFSKLYNDPESLRVTKSEDVFLLLTNDLFSKVPGVPLKSQFVLHV